MTRQPRDKLCECVELPLRESRGRVHEDHNCCHQSSPDMETQQCAHASQATHTADQFDSGGGEDDDDIIMTTGMIGFKMALACLRAAANMNSARVKLPPMRLWGSSWLARPMRRTFKIERVQNARPPFARRTRAVGDVERRRHDGPTTRGSLFPQMHMPLASPAPLRTDTKDSVFCSPRDLLAIHCSP